LKSASRRSVRQIRNSITFRVAFVFGLLFSIGIIAFGGLIYAITARELTARSDQILHQEARMLVSIPAAELPRTIRAEVAQNIHGLNYFALLSGSGQRLEGNIDPIPGLKLDAATDIAANQKRGPTRAMSVATGHGETILLGRDISEIEYLLRRMIAIMAASSIAVIPTVLLVGGILSLGPLRRVQDLQTASRQIASGRFDVRIATTGRNDELDQIATTINAMVEDIERVISQVKNVTDTIAHDLRTPLTRVRNRLDDARVAGSVLKSGDSIDDLIGDLNIVLDRFAALLKIAELEASERRAGFGPVHVATLLKTVHELYAPVAEEAEIRFEVRADPEIQLHGDGSLLLEAIGNLVDNAIKFSSGVVLISVDREDAGYAISVRDDGPGIPEHEREAVLQRFYRSSHGAEKPGHGLGLSIVTAILHIHRFKLGLHDTHPGLLAKITIPDA